MKKISPGIDYIGITTPFYCNDGNGLFVLHKRSINCRDEVGKWDFGGGKLEFGESAEKSVLREVLEEYGCKGIIQEQLPAHSILRKQNGFDTHWLAIPFFVKVDLKKVTMNEPRKMSDLSFFTLDSLPTPMHSAVKYTMEHYSNYFNKYMRRME